MPAICAYPSQPHAVEAANHLSSPPTEPQRIPAALPGVLQWTLQHHPELRRMDAVRQAQSGDADTAEFGPPLTL